MNDVDKAMLRLTRAIQQLVQEIQKMRMLLEALRGGGAVTIPEDYHEEETQDNSQA